MIKVFKIFIIVYGAISTICIGYLFHGYLNSQAEYSHSTLVTGPTSINKLLMSNSTTSPSWEQAPEFETVKNNFNVNSSFNSTNQSTTPSISATSTVVPSNNYNNRNSKNENYDAKIRGLDQFKLGFAIKPEFQKVPNSWQQILYERKQKIEQKPLGKLNTKIILIYGCPEWLNYFNPGESPSNINPEFKCQYINYELSSGLNSANITDPLETLVRNSDAMVLPVLRHLDIHLWRIFNDNDDISTVYENGAFTVTRNIDVLKKPKAADEKLAIPRLIHFTLESPFYAWNSIKMQISEENRRRDLFASHWRGSDIYIPYFRWQYYNPNIRRIPQGTNYAEGRTKMAAIVVSNCKTPNDRMGLVRQIETYTNVDIYGLCGKDKNIDCRNIDCFKLIKKNYKFYLAFENSNCRDYITEKLYINAYGNDLVPIVYGAHPSDYKAIAPENSYIHIEDFESLEQLGFYLQKLDKNDTLYNEYFAWKGTGKFSETDRQHSALSEVCAYLHADGMEVDGNGKSSVEDKQTKFGNKIENSEETVIPYFNKKDKYNFTEYHWSTDDERLCLKRNVTYWNR